MDTSAHATETQTRTTGPIFSVGLDGWIRGTVVTVKTVENFGYIKCDVQVTNTVDRYGRPKDVRFWLDKANWPVQLHDIVEVKVDMRKPDTPFAFKVRRYGDVDERDDNVPNQIDQHKRHPRATEQNRNTQPRSAHNVQTYKRTGLECRSDQEDSDSTSDTNSSSTSESNTADSDDEFEAKRRHDKQQFVQEKAQKRMPRPGDSSRDPIQGKIDKLNDKDGYGFISYKTVENVDIGSEKITTPRRLYFNYSNANCGSFSLAIGDKVSFCESKRGDKPYAFNVHLIKCSARSTEDFEWYLSKLLSGMEENEGLDKAIMAIVCLPVWQSCGECTTLSIDAINMLTSFLKKLEKFESLQHNFAAVLETLLSTPLFIGRDSQYARYMKTVSDDRRTEKLLDAQCLIMAMMRLVPHKARMIVGLLEPLISNEKHSIDNFLYKLLYQCSKGLAGDRVDNLEWDEMPLVPSVKELTSGPLESTASIRPINVIGPYRNAQEYIDIYFRLLRADCFSALSKGVTDLLKGRLDPRDMKVYSGVRFSGIQISQNGNGLAVGLKVKLPQNVANWDNSSCLLFGNLLCISVSGTFQDPIWATVVNRDALKSDQMVVVELCSESNSLQDSEAILALHFTGGTTIMVESPTYYRAYQPVLKALQTMDTYDLNFKEELVLCRAAGMPETIARDCEFDASVLYEKSPMWLDVICYCCDESEIGRTTLDASQETAVKECLRNRVAIVQGPPGTGKTFIGVKIVEILWSMRFSAEQYQLKYAVDNEAIASPKQPLTTPIVIITYKNHALDEFLKETIRLFPGKVARIGGRSQDAEISSCTLNELCRKDCFRMSHDIYQQVKALRAELDILKEEVECEFESLHGKKEFTAECFVDAISDDQIIEFLKNCDWNKTKMKPFKSTDSDGWQKAGNKIQKQDVLDLLQCCQTENLHKLLAIDRAGDEILSRKMYHLLQAALKLWIPPGKKFIEFERQWCDLYAIGSAINQQSSKSQSKPDSDTDLNEYEIDVEETLKERLAAMMVHHSNTKESIVKQMKGFNGLSSSEERGLKPYLMEIAKELTNKIPLAILLSEKNLWKLNDSDRIKLIECLLYRQFQEQGKYFQSIVSDYQKKLWAKEELEDQQKITVLRQMKVVGMTVTGANIYRHLLSQLQPEIIIVEEAAEVLEPQLLAVIGSWVKHLIMIGDHLQLRPSVENYALVMDYHFDISMMERLINNNLPYATLNMQNRMKPEFAELLIDIYPRLLSNLSRVEMNSPANCIGTAMFFWHHEEPEISGRSFTNEGEACRAVQLALFLVLQGYNASQITILSPYLGQVGLIRRKLKAAETKYPALFTNVDLTTQQITAKQKILANRQALSTGGSPTTNSSIKVHTVDLYQGDENDFVIISLVRSNKNGKIGFVGQLNRRCVAQSRSRCGLYFIGNKNTIGSSKNWMPILDKMDRAGCIGTHISLHCPDHPKLSRVQASVANDIPIDSSFCQVMCKTTMSCNRHICSKHCQPKHSHSLCEEIVRFKLSQCNHFGSRKCHEQEDDIICKVRVPVEFQDCGHSGFKECCQKMEDIKCLEKCTKVLSCKYNHPCQKTCGELCDSSSCPLCEKILRAEAEVKRVAEKQKLDALLKQVQNKIDEIQRMNLESFFSRSTLSKEGDTASEYFDIEDLVKRYIQPDHNWFPEVTCIEKIINNKLEVKWLQVQKNLFDPSNHKLKFHGTNMDAVKNIIQNGFKMPQVLKKNRPMFGAGIYFATDSSKSAQKRYTRGSNMLLVCDVLLGKTLTVESAMKDMTWKELHERQYDSLFAKRGTKSKGGVLNDEFVVYNAHQAIPRYIVHYHVTDLDDPTPSPNVTTSGINEILVKHHIAKKSIKSEPDAFAIHFSIADFQFQGLIKANRQRFFIESVDYYDNLSLVEKFKNKRKEFQTKYSMPEHSAESSDEELGKYVLVFHDVNPDKIQSVVQSNFSMNSFSDYRRNYGYRGLGIFFPEFPQMSSGQLFLCKVLPGKVFNCSPDMSVATQVKSGYDSHRIVSSATPKGNGLVIFDMAQILPCYLINYKTTGIDKNE